MEHLLPTHDLITHVRLVHICTLSEGQGKFSKFQSSATLKHDKLRDQTTGAHLHDEPPAQLHENGLSATKMDSVPMKWSELSYLLIFISL